MERTHLTLQDRLVKELRLRGISTPDAVNAFAGEFIADYNRRFAKAPRHIRHNVDDIFTVIDDQLIGAMKYSNASD